MRISDWSSDVCSSDLPARRIRDDLVQIGAHIALRSGRLGIEDVGGVADHGKHAFRADGGQLRGGGGGPETRILVQLPVTGVEPLAEGRVTQLRIASGNRM